MAANRASSENPVVAAVNDVLGSADVGRGVGDQESGQLSHLGCAAGAPEWYSSDGSQEGGCCLVAADPSVVAVTMTCAPRAARSSAMAAPMPRVPPVTRALLPARSFASGSAGPASRLTGGVLMAWLRSVSAETRIGSALEGEVKYPAGD